MNHASTPNTATMSVVTYIVLSLCAGLPFSKPSELKDLSDANTNFGFKLYHQLLNDSDSGSRTNIFFSPWSISSLLAMTYEGAYGNTRTQMAELLEFQDIEEVHSKFHDLSKRIMEPSDEEANAYTFKQANRLYCAQRLQIEPEFSTTIEAYYNASVEKANFAMKPDYHRVLINEWVAQQTENKIQDLLPPGSIDVSTVLVLVNALYFKGKWEKPFDKHDTKEDYFYPEGADKVRVPMMKKAGVRLNYTHNEVANYEMLELPYSGDDISMFVILPKDKGGLDDVTEFLSAENIQADMDFLEERVIDLFLPKFQISSGFSLKEALNALGMIDAFNDDSDFRKMTKSANVSITDVYHKAYVDVNEEGTEASAATGTVVGSRSANRAINFLVDHPFLFFIRENETGTILFMGRIGNPSA